MANSVEENQKLVEVLKQIDKENEKNLETLKAQLANIREQTSASEEGVVARERQKKLAEVELELGKLLVDVNKQKLIAGEDYSKVLQSMNAEELKLLGIQKDQINSSEDLVKALDRGAKSIEKSEKEAKKLESTFKKIKQQVVDIGNAFGFGQLSLSGLKAGTLDLLTSTDALTKGFEKQYHLSDVYTESIVGQYTAMTRLGVTMEDATKAQGAFASTVTDFTMMSRSQRDALTESALVHERLGIAIDDTAKATQNSIKFFGASGDGAIKIQNEIMATAKALGRSPQEMASEFAQAGGSLAKFGTQGVKAFKDLSRISKLTGMDVQKLLNVTNKFDTFEGAAESAGQLNAALGGNFVNAMDLMMATDPAERFGMIRDALDNAGLSFDDMSYYQKQFYTESLGLSDVGELAQLMSGDMDDLGGATNATAQELIDQKNSAQELMTIQEELRATMLQIANAAMPLLKIVQALSSFLVENTLVTKALLLVYGLFKSRGILSGLGTGLSKLFGKFSSGTKVLKENTDALEGGISPFEKFIETVNKIEPKKMMAFGFSMLLIGGAVLAAAYGISLFVTAFAGMTAGKILAVAVAIGVFGGMMVGLAFAMASATAAVPTMLAMGLAFVLLGAAVGIAAIGMIGIASAMTTLAGIDLGVYGALSAMMWSIAGASIGILLAGGALVYFSLALMGLGFALRFISTRDLEAIATFTKSLAEMELENMRELASLMERVAKAMDSIPVGTTIVMKAMMDSVSTAASAATGLAQAAIAPAPGAVGGSPNRGKDTQLTINLTLDGEILAKKVLKITQNNEGTRASEAQRGIGGTAYSTS